MLAAAYTRYVLHFREPAGTSRGVLHHKTSYFVRVEDDGMPGLTGIGECSILPGLSPDDRDGLEACLERSCIELATKGPEAIESLSEWPAVRFAFEMALHDLDNGGQRILFPTTFTADSRGIPINGLIWMNTPEHMLEQVEKKIKDGFRVIKMKIGAISFEQELAVLKHIRKHYPAGEIELRLDANGAFLPGEALEKLEKLSVYDIHSIEQPIQAGQIDVMADLCRKSPIPIALDEELIGISTKAEKQGLIEKIRPQYLILKPSLLGGFAASAEWLDIAGAHGAGWWVTSALESNIGLSAIAQWTAGLGNRMPQGLGTGSLYTNNIPSPLRIMNGCLHFDHTQGWDLDGLHL